MSLSSRVLVFALTMTLYIVEMASAETLCGGELVDALQFVCGDRGFHFNRPGRSDNRRSQNRGIVEECCFSLNVLEQYCAKPAKSERDVSVHSLQVIPVLKQEVPRKQHVTSNYKYIHWQRKAAQRLRRIVPSILRTRKFRWQADQRKANEEFMLHAPMMALSNMMIFSGKNNSNYATVKLSKQQSCYYTVRVFNNECIDTSLYSSQSKDFNRPTDEKTTIDDMVERIKKGVSFVLPRITVSRVKMMAPELNETDFSLLLSKLRNDNIKVTGEEEYLSSVSSSMASETSTRVSTDHQGGVKRTTEDVTGSPDKKNLKADDQLSIFDSYFESD
ncbi:uncharacterized protein LOC134038680 [Osmerus eperlanus]|uniref:uncharacterized protein LOC134038680 n=1 Tax=Osmerus eperlanus TaxID=29151 RepID=UPI002E132B21